MNKVTLTITFENGAVNVAGPITDKMFCYGLLEMAKQAIADYKPSAIQVATPGLTLKES